MPHVHRTWGVRVEDERHVTVFVPDYSLAHLEASIADNGEVALVVGEPVSHETYQLKGKVTRIGPAPAADVADFDAHANLIAELFAPQYSAPVEALRAHLGNPALSLTFEVRDVYLQTPGPGAGKRVAAEGGV